MEKTIIIDDKPVVLKVTGATPLRYKAQFGTDFLSEVLKLNNLNKNKNKIEKIDFELFYNIIWVMAKTAKPDIPEPLTWFDSFGSIPLLDIIPEIQDLLAFSIQGKKK